MADNISSLEKRLGTVSEAEILKYSQGQGLVEAKETFSNMSRDTTAFSKAGRLMQGGKKPYLLGSSTKLEHNDASGLSKVLGSRQLIQYMQPANASKIPGCNTCGSNTKGCTSACLGGSGQLGLASGEIAKEARTAMAWHEPGKYLALLNNEVGRREKSIVNEGRIPVMRLNGTSDIGWHRIAAGAVILGGHPGVEFSEYTKFNTGDVVEKEDPNEYPNYHWIHSVTERTSTARIKQITETETRSGGRRNVAVPFNLKKGDPVPDVTKLTDRSGASISLPVVKEGGKSVGDLHDMRVRDPQVGGAVVLRAKEVTKEGKRGVFDTTGFIRPMESPVETPVTMRGSRRGAAGF